jgi:hypothetical protein
METDQNAVQCWWTGVPTALGAARVGPGADNATDADGAVGPQPGFVGSLDARPSTRGRHATSPGQGSAEQLARMDSETKEWLLAAARRATQRYPGAVGELLSQELLSWMVFGHQLGSSLIMRVADDLLLDERRPC